MLPEKFNNKDAKAQNFDTNCTCRDGREHGGRINANSNVPERFQTANHAPAAPKFDEGGKHANANSNTLKA